MSLEKWQVGDRDTLRELSTLLPPYHSLRYPDFVDHYYGAADWSRLFVMRDEAGKILSCAGIEKLPLTTPDGPKTLAIGTNYHTFQPGAGAFLFLHWFRSGDLGGLFGGSADARNLVLNQKAFTLTECAGLKTLQLNHAYADSPSEAAWRRVAKFVLRHAPLRTRIDRRAEEMLRCGATRIEAVPEDCFTDDMRVEQSEFAVRFQPSTEYLNWRYASGLEFVAYRVFRIVADGQPAGFVVLNEQPHRVIVAHCDGPDSWTLTQGIYAALAQVCRGSKRGCGVLLCSSNPAMRAAFQQFGFREQHPGRALALGARRLPAWASDGSQWLINYDWGDNGQRPPFLGAAEISDTSASAAIATLRLTEPHEPASRAA